MTIDNLYILIILLFIYVVLYITTRKPKLVEGLNTFNGRMAIDDQYYFDQIFDDVIYYPNEYDKDYKTAEEIGHLVKTGWQKCKELCSGNCVEFGLTGASYCFSY